MKQSPRWQKGQEVNRSLRLTQTCSIRDGNIHEVNIGKAKVSISYFVLRALSFLKKLFMSGLADFMDKQVTNEMNLRNNPSWRNT